MMDSSHDNAKSQKGRGQHFWILYSITIVFFLISSSILYLMPTSFFSLFTLIVSGIIILNAALLEILVLNPNLIGRRITVIILGCLGAVGIYLSWVIWSGLLSPSKIHSIGESFGYGASMLSSVTLFHYLRKQKIIR